MIVQAQALFGGTRILSKLIINVVFLAFDDFRHTLVDCSCDEEATQHVHHPLGNFGAQYECKEKQSNKQTRTNRSSKKLFIMFNLQK